MQALFADALPVAPSHMATVRRMLVQPQGEITNATGHHPFGGTWPAGTEVAAKTGSANDGSGRGVRWLVGHVTRGARSWTFVSTVVGGPDVVGLAAVRRAETASVPRTSCSAATPGRSRRRRSCRSPQAAG
ncbi:MAG: hypothetical protein R2712_29005 [Vicinamibacterales bacterium]